MCFGVSVGGFLRADDGGRPGVDTGVFDLKFVRDVGLDGGWAEVNDLLSLASAWSGVPLANEDGGGLSVALALDFVDVALTVFEGGLAVAGDGPGLVVGGAVVG